MGIVRENRTSLTDTYIQCYDFRADGENAGVRSISRLVNDRREAFDENAIEITFTDGSRDIVFYAPARNGASSFKKESLKTDARAALIRFNAKDEVKYAEITGGTFLNWRGRSLLKCENEILKGVLDEISGDLSGDRSESALILRPMTAFPEGATLKDTVVIAGFNKGNRREAYKLESVKKLADGRIRLNLAGHPFFADLFGEVRDLSRGNQRNAVLRPNEFNGTETYKGLNTRYLVGSKVAFPEVGLEFILKGSEFLNRYDLAENVDLQSLGIYPGMRFVIYPDWKNSVVEIMLSVSKEF